MSGFLQPEELDTEGFPDDFWPDDEWFAAEKRRVLDEAERAQVQDRGGGGGAKIVEWRKVQRRAVELEHQESGREDTWQHLDLNDAFDKPQQLPEVGEWISGEKSNGGGIFYLGKINEVHGPSESGKTMFALAVMAQEIRKGNNVVMIDFEDDARAIVNRLHWVFGLTRQEITHRLFYYRPDQAFNETAYDRVKQHGGVTLALIDAVTEGMSAAGLDGRNENEVATWFNEFPKKLARLGWAVCLIDHTPGSDGGRAIGSQHKKSGIDGVSYTAESVSKFAKGRAGQLRIKVAKDKVGGVRPEALPQKDGQEWRGDLRIDGTENPSRPKVGLWGVEPALLHGTGDDSHLDRGVMPGGPGENDRLAVMVALREGPAAGMSTNAICTYIGGRKQKVQATLEWMRNSGEILWAKEGNTIIHGLPTVRGEDVQEVLEDG